MSNGQNILYSIIAGVLILLFLNACETKKPESLSSPTAPKPKIEHPSPQIPPTEVQNNLQKEPLADAQETDEAIAKIKSTTPDFNPKAWNSRVYTILQTLVGRPYKDNPLGEGDHDPKGDTDPVFRLDSFDCMTLVETVMAAAMTETLDDTRTLLQKIRYLPDTDIHWKNRKHFTYFQWIPENQKMGFIREATYKIATDEITLTYQTRLETYPRKSWTTFIQKMEENYSPGISYLPVITLVDLAEVEKNLVTPSVAFIVRVDNPDVPNRISHVALIANDDQDQPVVFHASKTRKKVERLSYQRWVRLLKRQSAINKRKTEGVNFQEILPYDEAWKLDKLPDLSIK